MGVVTALRATRRGRISVYVDDAWGGYSAGTAIPDADLGTSGGQVYASSDAGDHWTAIVRDLPPVVSVEVQTLP